MDRREKNEKVQSKETTPLLCMKESADPNNKANIPKYDSVSGSSGRDSGAAGTSKAPDEGKVSQSSADGVSLEAEVAEKRRENEEEFADAINSYEGMANVVSPKFGCGLFYGIWLFVCYSLSSFAIQFPLHVLLLSLPISFGFMGARYMTKCPMNVKLPYAMMVVGGMGALALLVRITLLLHTKFSTDERLKNWLEKATMLFEFLFFLSFIIEFYFLHEKTPSDAPLSSNYCNKNFYNFARSINDVLVALVVVRLFLCFMTGQRCIRRAAPP